MALDRNPVEFAAFLPPFLALYSTNALTAPDAAGVYALPAKRRVLLTTFLARALVCPHYEPDMIKFIKMKGMLLIPLLRLMARTSLLLVYSNCPGIEDNWLLHVQVYALVPTSVGCPCPLHAWLQSGFCMILDNLAAVCAL